MEWRYLQAEKDEWDLGIIKFNFCRAFSGKVAVLSLPYIVRLRAHKGALPFCSKVPGSICAQIASFLSAWNNCLAYLYYIGILEFLSNSTVCSGSFKRRIYTVVAGSGKSCGVSFESPFMRYCERQVSSCSILVNGMGHCTVS